MHLMFFELVTIYPVKMLLKDKVWVRGMSRIVVNLRCVRRGNCPHKNLVINIFA